MKTTISIKGVAIALLLFTATVAWGQDSDISVSAGNTASARTPGVHVQQKLGAQVPLNATFKDKNGQSVTFGDLLGDKPAVVLPIFYRCHGVCSTELDNLVSTLAKVPKRVGRDYDVIVLSVDPKENPSIAEARFKGEISPVAAFKGTNPGWHFLTGSLDQIRNVTDALGFFYSYDPQTDLINHPAGLMFLTHDGRVSAYILNPYTYSPDAFNKNLALAVTSTVGTPVPDQFFGCVHCDPVTGQKSINILRVLSIGGIVILVALGSLVAFLMKNGGKAQEYPSA